MYELSRTHNPYWLRAQVYRLRSARQQEYHQRGCLVQRYFEEVSAGLLKSLKENEPRNVYMREGCQDNACYEKAHGAQSLASTVDLTALQGSRFLRSSPCSR